MPPSDLCPPPLICDPLICDPLILHLRFTKENILSRMVQEMGSDDPGRSTRGEGAEGSEGSVNSQLLQLMARHAQLTDRLHAHHLIGMTAPLATYCG